MSEQETRKAASGGAVHVLATGRIKWAPTTRVVDTSGRKIAVCFIVANIPSCDGDFDDSILLGIVAFGEPAVALSQCAKGDPISVSGKLRRCFWNGEQQLQVLADSVIGPRASKATAARRHGSVVHSGKEKAGQQKLQLPVNKSSPEEDDGWDDPVGF